MTGRNDAGGLPADDEHQRFARYLQDLAQVREENEVDLVSVVLRDPDATMAQSAVVRHLDNRAARLLTDAGFPDWAHSMATVIGEREFLIRRLREWTLLRSITMGDPWTPEDLATASDWFQRNAAETLTSPAALTLLAGEGRTRRVRAAAGRRIAQRQQ
ncbi:hypothetical protein GCM10023194_66760 [Planotetraspora phitsanulokensis]|uniref:Uncharacterized protein n=1 Tax=Planotetraspora phitsanulokensis TaxID=575192 RepID=A0A8J3U9X6_9ACTN|nr:hypothetical protein [Planotetraspora phitsanulokensis]GII39762.1 hypothetical protein Pph01_47650 [Planotetraspora phitsanulokensis]